MFSRFWPFLLYARPFEINFSDFAFDISASNYCFVLYALFLTFLIYLSKNPYLQTMSLSQSSPLLWISFHLELVIDIHSKSKVMHGLQEALLFLNEVGYVLTIHLLNPDVYQFALLKGIWNIGSFNALNFYTDENCSVWVDSISSMSRDYSMSSSTWESRSMGWKYASKMTLDHADFCYTC